MINVVIENIGLHRADISGHVKMRTLIPPSIEHHCTFERSSALYRHNMMTMNIKRHLVKCFGKSIGFSNDEFANQNKTEAEFADLYGLHCDTTMKDGISTNITEERNSYSYTAEVDYVNRFVRDTLSNDRAGINATTTLVSSSTGSPYPDRINKYHDDNETLSVQNTHLVSDEVVQTYGCDSILKKTKDLFRKKKINSIISRFHTEGIPTSNSVVTEKFNESHGRNLLLKSTEEGGQGYLINGYDNPYCRVWTHHYRYDQLGKTMRPFTMMNNDGSPREARTHIHYHKYKDKMISDSGSEFKPSERWRNSVLNERNGLVDFTPIYRTPSEKDKQIHTKKTMFSIENLAWKDYDPYSFDQALSWEQRGPNGGRIMWFPPYGLEFSETSSATWTEHNFLGRGEGVYTYANTKRTGSLTFTLLIDHPSIVDYVTMGEAKNENKHKDTDWFRFFAGCDPIDPNDSNSLLSLITNTHLDDEAIENIPPPPPKPEQKPVETPPPPKEEEPLDDDGLLNLSFVVFYPNNYSGFYDREKKRSVEPIAYLLNGFGANVIYNEANDKKLPNNVQDIPISFKDLSTNNVGYEISDNGISHDIEKIKSEKNFLKCISPFVTKKGASQVILNKKVSFGPYYYRADYSYEKYRTDSEHLYNTINQKFSQDSYEDNKSFNFNKSINGFKDSMSQFVDHENVFSLLEVASAVAILKGYKPTIKTLGEKLGVDLEQKPSDDEIKAKNTPIGRVYYIIDVFTNYKLDHIRGYGFSNIHGRNANAEVNRLRNIKLAEERFKTIVSWLKEHMNEWSDVEQRIIERKASSNTNETSRHNVDAKNAKLLRSATCTLRFRKEGETKSMTEVSAQDLSNADNQGLIENEDGTTEPAEDFKLLTPVLIEGQFTPDGEQLYRLEKDPSANTLYYKDKETDEFRIYIPDVIIVEKAKTPNRDVTKLGEKDLNVSRYDQEYRFFKELEIHHKLVFDQLKEKVQFFDPAFHSITPEGFNARLTFLNQCTRQGFTRTRSDIEGGPAKNLAFGRPPFCVLRVGDFYNQMIVINSVDINYNVSDGVSWDLNIEGAGVQPMLARVTIQFNFIGGGDLSGAIRRLQNANTFNYYANTSLYDNRADFNVITPPDHIEQIVDEKKTKRYSYNPAMNKELRSNLNGYN